MSPRRQAVLPLAALLAVMVLAAPAASRGQSAPARAASAPARPSGRVALSERHFWRKCYAFFPPSLSARSPEAATRPGDDAWRRQYLAKTHDAGLRSPAPPQDWAAADFDDADWLLRRGREFLCGDGRLMTYNAMDETSACLRGGDPFVEHVGLVCQRGKFIVPDRSRVRRLSLSLTYRGGFVAYLNGREVARAHLPEGALGPATPADDYPLAAWFYAEGKDKGKFLNAFDPKAPWELRERTFGPVEVPVDFLRDGVNVLAVELHRSDYPPELAKAKYEYGWQRGWSTVGLSLLTLTAEPDGAVQPAPARSAGPQAWTADITKAVSDRARANLDEKLSPVRIVAVRNGSFSGQVVLADDKPLEDLSATVSPLKQVGGAGVIPASAVQVRYGAVNPLWQGGLEYLDAVVPVDLNVRTAGGMGRRLDMLLDAPPAGALTVAVWLTVNVPKDAAPGRYAGQVVISVKGAAPIQAPIDLHLADWTLPGVKDYVTRMNIYQSPETLALYYNVEPWSAAHWRLIERSFRLMGRAGNVGLFLPLLAESQRGNAESYVHWIPQPDPSTGSGPADGSYKYDFGLFDRYLDMAMKYHDPARLFFVCLVAWGFEGDKEGAPVMVTAVDPATGQKSNLKLPLYATPQAEALWKPLLAACRERLRSRGLEKKILLGMSWDVAPKAETVGMFASILPGVGWLCESHMNQWSYGYGTRSVNEQSRSRWDRFKYEFTAPVKYNSVVWGGGIPDPKVKRLYGWNHAPDRLTMNFNRVGVDCLHLMGYASPWAFHMWMESTIACGRAGNGNVGGDYWGIVDLLNSQKRIPNGGSGASWNGSGTLYGVYPASNVGRTGVGNNTTDLFAPAPEGPVSTVRFENALENNQETEARIFIEKALLDKARPLPGDLAARCQQMLDERTNVLRYWSLGAGAMAPYKWQERNRRLFDAAAQVQQALAGATGPAARRDR